MNRRQMILELALLANDAHQAGHNVSFNLNKTGIGIFHHNDDHSKTFISFSIYPCETFGDSYEEADFYLANLLNAIPTLEYDLPYDQEVAA